MSKDPDHSSSFDSVILIPVRDDWGALSLLLQGLDAELAGVGRSKVLIVDDCSETKASESGIAYGPYSNIEQVSVLELKRNLGHQRAIALGLTFIELNVATRSVLVMDGDGEDTPKAARALLDRSREVGPNKIVFARRAERSEGPVFRLGYSVFRILYKVMTGKDYRFGNFSVIPAKLVGRLSVISEGWNHYASAVQKARIPFEEIDTIRGERLDGKSKMNLTSLVIHGLSAISVHSDVVGVRLLAATLGLTLVSVVLVALVAGVRLFTNLAVPGWATYVTAFLVVILLQSVTLSFFFSFIVLGGRENATFIPERDYHYFIQGESLIFEQTSAKVSNV